LSAKNSLRRAQWLLLNEHKFLAVFAEGEADETARGEHRVWKSVSMILRHSGTGLRKAAQLCLWPPRKTGVVEVPDL